MADLDYDLDLGEPGHWNPLEPDEELESWMSSGQLNLFNSAELAPLPLQKNNELAANGGGKGKTEDPITIASGAICELPAEGSSSSDEDTEPSDDEDEDDDEKNQVQNSTPASRIDHNEAFAAVTGNYSTQIISWALHQNHGDPQATVEFLLEAGSDISGSSRAARRQLRIIKRHAHARKMEKVKGNSQGSSEDDSDDEHDSDGNSSSDDADQRKQVRIRQQQKREKGAVGGKHRPDARRKKKKTKENKRKMTPRKESVKQVANPTANAKAEDVCKVCGKVSRYGCSLCKVTKYCSKVCQSADWSDHKAHCHSIRAGAAPPVVPVAPTITTTKTCADVHVVAVDPAPVASPSPPPPPPPPVPAQPFSALFSAGITTTTAAAAHVVPINESPASKFLSDLKTPICANAGAAAPSSMSYFDYSPHLRSGGTALTDVSTAAAYLTSEAAPNLALPLTKPTAIGEAAEKQQEEKEEEEDPVQFQCSHCSKVLNSDVGLRIHHGKMHADEKQPAYDGSGYQCSTCSKLCKSQSGLARHQRIHKKDEEEEEEEEAAAADLDDSTALGPSWRSSSKEERNSRMKTMIASFLSKGEVGEKGNKGAFAEEASRVFGITPISVQKYCRREIPHAYARLGTRTMSYIHEDLPPQQVRAQKRVPPVATTHAQSIPSSKRSRASKKKTAVATPRHPKINENSLARVREKSPPPSAEGARIPPFTFEQSVALISIALFRGCITSHTRTLGGWKLSASQLAAELPPTEEGSSLSRHRNANMCLADTNVNDLADWYNNVLRFHVVPNRHSCEKPDFQWLAEFYNKDGGAGLFLLPDGAEAEAASDEDDDENSEEEYASASSKKRRNEGEEDQRLGADDHKSLPPPVDQQQQHQQHAAKRAKSHSDTARQSEIDSEAATPLMTAPAEKPPAQTKEQQKDAGLIMTSSMAQTELRAVAKFLVTSAALPYRSVLDVLDELVTHFGRPRVNEHIGFLVTYIEAALLQEERRKNDGSQSQAAATMHVGQQHDDAPSQEKRARHGSTRASSSERKRSKSGKPVPGAVPNSTGGVT